MHLFINPIRKFDYIKHRRRKLKNTKRKPILCNYPKMHLFISMSMAKVSSRHYSYWQKLFGSHLILENSFDDICGYSFFLQSQNKSSRRHRTYWEEIGITKIIADSHGDKSYWFYILPDEKFKSLPFENEYKNIQNPKYRYKKLSLKDMRKIKLLFSQNKAKDLPRICVDA